MAASQPHDPPRRQQRGVTICSDRALARLVLLTRGGRSQAEVIEEALERMPLPTGHRGTDDARRCIDTIIARGRSLPPMAMAEIDAREYDEGGNCR